MHTLAWQHNKLQQNTYNELHNNFQGVQGRLVITIGFLMGLQVVLHLITTLYRIRREDCELGQDASLMVSQWSLILLYMYTTMRWSCSLVGCKDVKGRGQMHKNPS